MRRHLLSGSILAFIVALRAANATCAPPAPSGKTATVVAGAHYQAGSIRRFFLGDTYRDLWTTPVTVPVLDLHTYAGGLTPTKVGKGNQTRSLRFKNPDGLEFVFRLVDKYKVNPSQGWENTIVGSMARDQVSAQHPAGAIVAHGFLAAAGVLHPEPKLVVLPDDPALGKFRKDFAGILGWIEPYPNVPDHGPSESAVASRANIVYTRPAPGFAGAIEIIDSDSLQVLLDADPHQQVDDRAYLKARLVDMFLNDWDRHPGNWKWARLQPGGRWQPIARDRDKVMVSYGGLAALAGRVTPELVRFNATYPSMHSLTIHSLDLDRRLLCGLDAAAFDSTAMMLEARFTDALIDSALGAMPAEYQKSAPRSAAILRARRDEMRSMASAFYHYLSPYVDIHATDETDRATVTLTGRRFVDVEVSAGDAPPHYHRRFDANDTKEIRLYVHGGDDDAVIRGQGPIDMRVRIIGGNGHNRIVDSRTNPKHDTDDVRVYDTGNVTGVQYPPHRIQTANAPDEPNYDRRPLLDYAGVMREVPVDRGAKISPVAHLDAPGDLGLVPGLGISRVRYGFRMFPYSSRLNVLGEYATGVDAFRVTATGDKRWESSPLHLMATARMSELEVLNFYGYGNDTPDGPEAAFAVKQKQWLFHPALAWTLGMHSDVAFGPILQYSTIDSVPGRYISEVQPYGYGNFGEAGLRLGFHSDTRDHSLAPAHHRNVLLDLCATAYPAVWDVRKPYGALDALAATYIPLPVPVHPIVALKAGGRKLIGSEFPFHDAAFLGGRPSERGLPRERYAGDASIFGTAELRIPVAQFSLLLPFDTGVYFYGDAGRVYMDGASPGGWHTTDGAGAWIGILSPATALCVEWDRSINSLEARIGLSF